MKRFCLGLIAATAALWTTESHPAAARFVAGLSSIKVTALRGQVVTEQYRLTLDKNERPTRFTFRLEDWWRSEDGQQSFYEAPGTLERSCSRWVTVNPADVIVQPGATITARVTIAVPVEITPGGHWCVLTVEEAVNPLDTPQGVGAQFVASVSTGIFVYVEPVQRAVDFEDVRVGDATASVKLRNRGNAPVGVDGRFEFFRADAAAPVAAATFARTTILPSPISTGVLTATLPPVEQLPSGAYRVRVVIDIGLDHYLGVERQMKIVRGGAAAGGEPAH